MRRISTGESMRSEAIFRAKEMIENKFTLCLSVSKATRRTHISIGSGAKLPVLIESVQELFVPANL
jgi:hypothetical protein